MACDWAQRCWIAGTLRTEQRRRQPENQGGFRLLPSLASRPTESRGTRSCGEVDCIADLQWKCGLWLIGPGRNLRRGMSPPRSSTVWNLAVASDANRWESQAGRRTDGAEGIAWLVVADCAQWDLLLRGLPPPMSRMPRDQRMCRRKMTTEGTQWVRKIE